MKTHPAGGAVLTLSKEQCGALQYRPGRGPVLPIQQDENRTNTAELDSSIWYIKAHHKIYNPYPWDDAGTF